VTVDISRAGVSAIAEALIVHDEDPLATNSADHPDRVTAQPVDARLDDGKLTITLPAISWAAVSLAG
jgi:alpha-N-arabinofuranosidase